MPMEGAGQLLYRANSEWLPPITTQIYLLNNLRVGRNRQILGKDRLLRTANQVIQSIAFGQARWDNP